MSEHSREEVIALLNEVEVAAIATSTGDKVRLRMMHHASDENFNIYLATMKGDPKALQMTNHPSVSVLAHHPGGNINESREVEITGKAIFVHDQEEREHALRITAERSPVVKYLTETGNSGVLDCIKIVPETVKLRVFSEIVQGMPPTVFEFPQNREVVSDWQLLKMKLKSWRTAVRIPFLTASGVPVLLGGAIAWFTTGSFQWGLFLLTLIAGLLIHTGANVINDYFDHRSGNDEANREFVRPFSGGSRVIQLGLLSPVEVLAGALVAFFISALIGFYLAWTAGPLVLVLGAIGLVSSAFYTGGPLNWARKGVGELLVGLNFGILMTLGAYYVQTSSFSWLPVIAAVPVALLIAAVLYINEYPDYLADRQVGKNTLVVRLGRERATVLYALMMAGVYLSIAAAAAAGALPLTSLLGLLTLPLAVRAIRYARKYHSSSFELIPANAMTVTSHLATGLLLTLAFVWEAIGVQGLVYVLGLGAVFAAVMFLMYRYIEKQKNVFLGLKQAVR
ncbi:MAG: 1,4-dihydroxy-2-naphthoate octaprenyltransferase [Chloroflexi bacterium]|nr:1,4-dihydroxy-2-naphthoate octaprenyltransferase [Chloroflexota bacterium]